MAIDFSNVYIDNSGCFEYVLDREQPVPYAYITNVRMLEQNCDIPAQIDPDAKTSIGDPDIYYFVTGGLEGTFRNNTNVTNVSLPSTVTSIGDYTFAKSSIKEQDFIPSDLEYIGSCAYLDTTISNLVFSNCIFPLFVNDYAFAIENESYYSISKNVIFANSGDLRLSNYIFDNCTANCMFDNVYYVNLSEHTFSNMFSGSVNFNNSHICVNGNSENIFAGVNDVIVNINSIVALDGEGSQNTIKDLNKLFTNSGIQAWFDTSDRTIYTTKNELNSSYTRWNDYLNKSSTSNGMDLKLKIVQDRSIPSYMEGSYMEMENGLFSNSNIKSLTIDVKELYILDRGFENCTYLENIELYGHFFVGEYAFANIIGDSMNPIKFSGTGSIEWVNDYGFYNSTINSEFISDMMPAISHVGNYAFANCDRIEGTVLFYACWAHVPGGSFTFGKKVFDNCKNLTSVYFNASYDDFKNIVDYSDSYNSFGNCEKLGFVGYNDVTFVISNLNSTMYADNVVGNLVFTNNCHKIEQLAAVCSVNNISCLDLDEKIQVSSYGFADLTTLENLDLTWFDIVGSEYTFDAATGFKIITNANDIPYAGFSGCANLQKVTLSSDFNSNIIPEQAFSSCCNLKSLNKNEIVAGISQDDVNNIFPQQGENIINIPYGIETIDSYAFGDCKSITHVYIPDTVTTINASAFAECTSLESVYIGDGIQSIDDSAFDNINSNVTFYMHKNNNVAQTYCEDKGFTYDLIESDDDPEDIPEDVNPSSKVVANQSRGKCFLAGVGNAELFKVVDGKEYMFASAKTLTESSITIGVSEEDIRAGMGAKLYGKYFHTSTFDLKLADAMFRLEYLAASVGSEIDFGGEVFKTVEMEADEDGSITVADAVPMTGTTTFIYIKKPEDEYFGTYELGANDKVTDLEAGSKYCVKYLYTNDNARTLIVKANFTPDTLRLYLTCNLYSGDDKNPSTGTKIGSITIMVPRFMLKGNQDLSMNMTGAATTSLEGSALAADAEGCEGEGIYAKIIEVIDGFDWRSMIYEMTFDNSIESIEDCYIYDEFGLFDKFYDEVSIYLKFIDGTKPKKMVVDKDYTLAIIPNENNASSFTINQNSITSNSMCSNFEVKAQGIGDFKNYIAIKKYI